MNLNEVHRGIHKNKKRKRVGRGPGSGHGKTSGRGHKGARSRSGYSMHPTFEGGQMPLVRRVPKRGFNNPYALAVAVVNLAELEECFEVGAEVTAAALREKCLAKGRWDILKILGDGELTKALTVTAHRFSKSAREKIERAGGTVNVLPGKKPVVKNKMNSRKRGVGTGASGAQ
ncbi:MAG: 50S ribosomal protein L15 [Patescibacteria group bacterium]|nr:50S ribosomal protein L15 [Patescibacteria group bacterium]